VAKVAEMLDTTERQIWRLLKRGDLKGVRMGPKMRRIFASEIARYQALLQASDPASTT
jgi:hypothetical protein